MSLPALSPNAWLRYPLVREALRSAPVRSVVEVGCGGGALGARLALDYEYVGFEPDEATYRQAFARIAPRGSVVNAYLPNGPTRHFDALVACEVLEHIEADDSALANWRDWLSPGGVLVMSVPADPKRFSAADEAAGHFRRYERAGLTRQLTAAGFVAPVVWHYGFPLGYVLEGARNQMAKRRKVPSSVEERTMSSGRWMQPKDRMGVLTDAATLPFRAMQRFFRDTTLGPGIVATARAPLT